MSKSKVIALVGPTASGKTSLSIKLAQKFNGEIISADSRQIYKGLDIGTGKITTEEMEGITHHLINIASPADTYTAADFKRDSTLAINRIVNHDHTPIITGGTFFYLDLLRDKQQSAPVPINEKLRTELETYSTEELFKKLQEESSARAEEIDQHNRRRLIRSLEIIDSLGHIPPPTKPNTPYEWLIIGLSVEKEQLRENYRQRLNDWLKRGLVDEVKNLLENEVDEIRLQELGFEYTLVLSYIKKEMSLTELEERFVQKNWQYAKRQLTWLKRDSEVKWFKPTDTEEIFQTVTNFLQQPND